jgi:hypothetical protein
VPGEQRDGGAAATTHPPPAAAQPSLFLMQDPTYSNKDGNTGKLSVCSGG